MKIKDARSLSSQAQEALRMRAVEAVQKGMSQQEAARVFGVARQTVCKWCGNWKSNGAKALRRRPKGRPKGQKRLLGHQAARVVRIITDRDPEQLKLPFALWTRQAVQQLLEKDYGIKVSLSTVGRYLKAWGFTSQRPCRKAYEQNPKEVKAWMKSEYPAIKERAMREKAEIHWGDETALRSDHQAGTCYGKKGKTPVVRGTGKRYSCNMISSITNRGTLRFMVFKENFTATKFIEFMKRLIRSSGRKVFLIVDRHPVHRSAATKEFIREHEDRISLFFLPAYSPELNPDELLNNDLKSNAVGRRRAESQHELLSNVRGHLISRQKTPHVVANFFKGRHVSYAAD